MNAFTLSFAIWAGFMLVMILGLWRATRRGRNRARETEDIASRILPELGLVAERSHKRRFGEGSVVAHSTETWYPPTRQRAVKSS